MNTILEEAANQLSKTWRKFSVEEEYRVAWSNAYLSFMSCIIIIVLCIPCSFKKMFVFAFFFSASMT